LSVAAALPIGGRAPRTRCADPHPAAAAAGGGARGRRVQLGRGHHRHRRRRARREHLRRVQRLGADPHRLGRPARRGAAHPRHPYRAALPRAAHRQLAGGTRSGGGHAEPVPVTGTAEQRGHRDDRGEVAMTILYEQWEHQAQLLAPMLGTGVTVVRSGQELAEAVATYPDELLVVFGPSTALSEAVAFAERSRTRRPALKVVLLRQHLDVSVMTEALRAGVFEVVATRDPDAMAQACARALAAARDAAGVNGIPVEEAVPGGRVVAVFSGKGGTGVSTIATNLAVTLAAGGQKRVCLVDLDLAFGDVAI